MTDIKKGLALDTVPLSNGIHVPRRLHEELFEHIKPRFAGLDLGRPYKGKDMIAPAFYALHDPWHMGYCIPDWERKGVVPLRFLGCRYCSVRYYGRT